MKYAPILGSNMTGRIGGVVASHNTYGTFFRRYVVPVNPNTTGQQSQRAAFANVSQSWRQLSKAQQLAWTTAAPQHQVPNPIGGSMTLTGQALFMRLNTLRRRIGLPFVLEAPTTDEIPSITLPTIALDLDGSFTATFDAADQWNDPDGGIIVSASPLLSAGINFNGQFVDVGTAINPDNTPVAFQIPYSTVAGGVIRLRYRSSTPDGRLSDLVYDELTTPTQAIVTKAQKFGVTVAFFFSREALVADFSAGEFTDNAVAAISIAQAVDTHTIIATFAAVAAGDAWTLTPAGAGAAYTPPQSGVVVA